MKSANPDIIVLTRDPSLWSCCQFKDYCSANNLNLTFLNPFTQLSPVIWSLRPRLVIHRSSGVLFDDIDLQLLKHWQSKGATIHNPPQATEIFRDKDEAYFFLHNQGIRQIPTFFIRGPYDFEDPIFKNGVVVKPTRGNKGIGVQIFDQAQEAKAFWNSLDQDQRYLIQPKIKNFRDFRIFILNNQVLDCFYKDSPQEKSLNKELINISLQCSKTLKLKYCAWDWVKTDDYGWCLNEVNLSPGFKLLAEKQKEIFLKSLFLTI